MITREIGLVNSNDLINPEYFRVCLLYNYLRNCLKTERSKYDENCS